MASAVNGGSVRVTIIKSITRAAAQKTIERLFMGCKVFAKPAKIRNANFKSIPKRRGGRIWTKWANKAHAEFVVGGTAQIKNTPSIRKDLASVAEFVEVKAA